jgi:hypothetical protein
LVRKSFGTLDILSEDFFEVIISFFRQISWRCPRYASNISL